MVDSIPKHPTLRGTLVALAAVADFLEREREGVANDQVFLDRRTPFKKGDTGA